MPLTANLWWNCLHYNEWITVVGIRGAALYAFGQISDVELQTVCILSGIGYGSLRFEAFTDAYKMVKVTQPLPPPLDVVWFLDGALWAEIDAIVLDQGDPTFDRCDIFTFKGNQGGAWPVLWP